MIYGLNKHLIVQKRLLTHAEKQLAMSVFGTSIELEHIQIVAHRLVLKHYAISPNGNIYFHPANWCEDFTQDTILKQSWFIHELVHVWQYQQGVKLIRTALFDQHTIQLPIHNQVNDTSTFYFGINGIHVARS